MKIAVNACYGGFGLSRKVYEHPGIPWDGYGYLGNDDLGIESDNYHAYRADARLIAAIMAVGEDAASGDLAKVRVVEVPDGTPWYISDYDGMESVHERHLTW